MQDVPVGEIFARIGALEAEVRRLGQENSRLQETIVSRTEDVASRKEMGKLTKEIYRTSGRVGDLVTHVNTIDRYSYVIRPDYLLIYLLIIHHLW
jgi:HAMP domain-containing protein